jgi:hypothetical protein
MRYVFVSLITRVRYDASGSQVEAKTDATDDVHLLISSETVGWLIDIGQKVSPNSSACADVL